MTRLTMHARQFALTDEERPFSSISNADAASWLESHAPILECPEPIIEETFDYRLWSFRKHIQKGSSGYVITEFLPNVPWAGPRNTINAASGFHFREGRWFHGADDVFRDYMRWLLQPKSRTHRLAGHSYTCWYAHALWDWCCVSGDFSFGIEMLDYLVEEYQDWEDKYLQPCGLFYSDDDRDAMELSISSDGLRPTRNSAMCGSARAISQFASLAGRDDLSQLFAHKADLLQNAINSLLWDVDFYRVIPKSNIPQVNAGTFSFSQVDSANYVREELGYIPWYFELAKPEFSIAFQQLTMQDGFAAPYGITTAEQRHPRFNFTHEHECLWNGPVWPFATSQTLTACANLLHHHTQNYFTKEDYYRLLMQYTTSMVLKGENRIDIHWIDENMDPYTGRWLSRDILKSRGFPESCGGYERGKDYNHSLYVDLILSGLLGIDPSGFMLEVHPLIPDSWSFFRVQHIPFRGKLFTIKYDKDGSYYGDCPGITLQQE